LAAIGLRPSLLAADTMPDHPQGRTILHLDLRAMRPFPEFPVDRGEHLTVTDDDHHHSGPMLVAFEDCTEGPFSPDDLRVIAQGIRDGGLVCAVLPTASPMLAVLDSQRPALEALLAARR
jgi:hypothetical protein